MRQENMGIEMEELVRGIISVVRLEYFLAQLGWKALKHLQAGGKAEDMVEVKAKVWGTKERVYMVNVAEEVKKVSDRRSKYEAVKAMLGDIKGVIGEEVAEEYINKIVEVETMYEEMSEVEGYVKSVEEEKEKKRLILEMYAEGRE